METLNFRIRQRHFNVAVQTANLFRIQFEVLTGRYRNCRYALLFAGMYGGLVTVVLFVHLFLEGGVK